MQATPLQVENEQALGSDEALAARARQGDLPAFAELARRYQTPLKRFLSRWANAGAEDADDLVQDALVRVFRMLHKYSAERPFKPWLFTVSYRVALEKTRKTHLRYSGDVTAVPATGPQPPALAEMGEARGNLWRVARRVLNDEQFAAIGLYYVEDLSVAEVSSVLQKSPTAVKVLLHRARARLLAGLPDAGFFPATSRVVATTGA